MEEFYEVPDKKLIARRYPEYLSLYITPFFPKDKHAKILDIGCGYGLFLEACQRSGYKDVYGVDSGKSFTDYANNTLGLNNVQCGDVFEYLNSREDEGFDVITAMNFVEHIKKERVQELLGLIFAKLKMGGMLIVEVPNADSVHGVHTFFSDLTHEWAYTKSLISHLFRMQGFTDIRVLPNRVRSNKIIRLLQKMLTKIISGDDVLMYSGNIIAIGYKK